MDVKYVHSEKISNASLGFRYIFSGENKKNAATPLHWHKDFEIIRVLSGTLVISSSESMTELSGGESIFIPNCTLHSVTPHDCIFEAIYIPENIYQSTPSARRLMTEYIHDAVRCKNTKLTDQIFEMVKSSNDNYEFKILSDVFLLSDELCAEYCPIISAPGSLLDKIKPALSLITEEYSRNLQLNELAEACGISKSYFCRLFKRATNQKPMEYINICRVEHACNMLSSCTRSVTEMCYECGFNELSYFIVIFKKHTGMTPGEYVKRYNKI